jgi:hypothetical protein
LQCRPASVLYHPAHQTSLPLPGTCSL